MIDLAAHADGLPAWVYQRNTHIAAMRAAGEPMFLGAPDVWWEAGLFRCAEGHVSRMLIGTERGKLCRDCYCAGGDGSVWLTHPDDIDGPFALPVADPQAGNPKVTG